MSVLCTVPHLRYCSSVQASLCLLVRNSASAWSEVRCPTSTSRSEADTWIIIGSGGGCCWCWGEQGAASSSRERAAVSSVWTMLLAVVLRSANQTTEPPHRCADANHRFVTVRIVVLLLEVSTKLRGSYDESN